ncbi:MAG: AMP-binding protein [Plesiomonas sp.]|uniref:AMP-binding protein n=2 Tax=Plesiomonas sp. TaxID=2486279 RepID=UPI003F3D9412
MDNLLHHAFHQRVKEMPTAPALISEHGAITTYNELNRIANQFKQAISSTRASTYAGQTFIGILSNVNVGSVAALLGVLKMGKSYIPIDTLYSPIQLQRIIKETKMVTLVADRVMLEKYQPYLMNCTLETMIIFDESGVPELYALEAGKMTPCSYDIHHNIDCLETKNQPSDSLAYILHTSGSTGTPKGIMLSHRNALTFVRWMQKEFQLTKKDKVISRAPLKFDLSVFDIFNTLSVGAAIIYFDWNRNRDKNLKHKDYVRLLEREKATLLYTTPSTLITLIEKGGLFNKKNNLRTIMYAGEPFPVAKLRKLCELTTETKIANIYGPTETNIITFHWVQECDLLNDSIPLGYEIDDTEIIIVTDNGKHICQNNEIGEIWCRGGTVTLGYLNQPDLTKECLVTSPFHPYPAQFWRTGDYGYKDTKGVIHYKGRRDHIYKINGYRIEIGEIEEVTARLPHVHESCIVINKSGETGSIICHYSLNDGAIFNQEKVVEIMSTYLQAYKIPHHFIQHDELPKTSSGKIDRVRLQNHTTISII